MEEFILKNRTRIIGISTCLIIGLVVSLSMVFSGSLRPFLETAEAQSIATSTITVTAVVEAWLDFQVSTTTLNITPALIQADGTLNIGATPDLNISLGTNNPEGWEIDIRGANNGLLSVTRSETIASVVTTSTVATGTEAYGANATSTMVDANIGDYYDYYGSDTVGEIRTADRTLSSKITPNSFASIANMRVLATAAETTPPASDYSDTITLTASIIIP